MTFPQHIKTILWDVNPRQLDPTKHKRFLITRIAEKGTWKDVQWLRRQYALTEIKNMVSRSRNTSAKTKSFWKLM